MGELLIKMSRWGLLFAIVMLNLGLFAQEADNEFTIDAKLNTRGEIRVGGFQPDSVDNQRKAQFITGIYQFNFGYKRSWLEVRLSPKASGIWGSSSANLSLAEGWVSMQSKKGPFAKVGRQSLEYDDERILGYDDWSMTAPTHDALKFGYEGYGHKIHLILTYNQDSKNSDQGGDYYSGGLQPYKTMQTIWYHYDTPKSFFGISLIAMNIGMQNMSFNSSGPKTLFQQLYGTYMKLQPKYTTIEGAFYYQTGREEYNIPLSAFMGSFKFNFKPNDIFSVYGGYDYLSGDKYFAIPPEGAVGLILHDTIRGFNSIFGSHHDFYGAMDFFYLDSYVGDFTPGLQNAYVGGTVNPVKNLKIDASYHFYAITADLKRLKKPLGHEVELSAEYKFVDFVKLSAGYSFMMGTKTMEILQRVSENRQLHWGWIMLSVKPTIFTYAWNDKKKVKGLEG